ncbi:MAG: PDZ domain-containing protein [Acidobacteriota bacterium]|nr:PDZ domain-containing protein [Acidobacteriota bacterium]
MKHFSRPLIRTLKLLGVQVVAVLLTAPAHMQAQLSHIAQVIQDTNPILRTASQGYLGVLVGDVDSDSATKLKLKDVRGAVVTLLDHDAPAAQAGIRVNDVLLEVNGQIVEGAEQFGRMMREIPAGRKVKLLLSRDGSQQTITVELVDRKAMEQEVWNRIDQGGSSFSSPGPSMSMLPGGAGSGGGDVPSSGGFHLPFFGSSLNVGVMVEPLTSQMADYLGVPNGVMVKQVARKSEAALSGLKAFDVILKVGQENIATTADWERALRTNKGKPVQITILRDRKQQTITLQVDSRHHKSESDIKQLIPDGSTLTLATMDPNAFLIPLTAEDNFAAAMAWQHQIELLSAALYVELQDSELDPKQAEDLQRQVKKFRQEMEELEARSTGEFV